jgi:predicted RNA-binding Zn-ribbon protein involved in translation (DUF1610 family)
MFKRNQQIKALETRLYRYKKVAMEFFCPLCRTKRIISTGHRLTMLNYVQMGLITVLLSALLWPWAGMRGVLIIFPIWIVFASVRRMLFSRDVPCPHCGFDASWYKRDVKVARRLVDEFWHEKNTPLTEPPLEQNEPASINY